MLAARPRMISAHVCLAERQHRHAWYPLQINGQKNVTSEITGTKTAEKLAIAKRAATDFMQIS
ncbi:MAG: hypothetical protein AAF566_13890, partial [Pseudomonadota bacterium]